MNADDNKQLSLVRLVIMKIVEELQHEKNVQDIQKYIVNPILDYSFKRLYPYIIISCILFLVIFIIFIFTFVYFIKNSGGSVVAKIT